jgi:hypothetical protein
VKAPTRTIRVDAESHRALYELQIRYEQRWGTHVSLADLVRMGISLLNRDIANRERTPTPGEVPDGD